MKGWLITQAATDLLNQRDSQWGELNDWLCDGYNGRQENSGRKKKSELEQYERLQGSCYTKVQLGLQQLLAGETF